MSKNLKKQILHASGSEEKIFLAIPSRFASTRLPAKPLALIGGVPMVRRVALRALALAEKLREEGLDPLVVVATDDVRIEAALKDTGVCVQQTDTSLQSGTDRIAAALRSLEKPPSSADLVINIQGDEPFFSVEDVKKLIDGMRASPQIPMGTLAFVRRSSELFFRSSVVKVTLDSEGRALYFSRAPIPWPRETLGASGSEWRTLSSAHEIEFRQHVGVYAYRYKSLEDFSLKLSPSFLEVHEGLEQLRALEAGWKILVQDASEEPFGIDTPEDLERATARVHASLD